MSCIEDVILGDLSPKCKRHIAQLRRQNPAWPRHISEKQLALGGNLPGVQGKLVDVVHTLAANLNRIMDDLRAKRDPRGANGKLARIAKVSSNTIDRARRGDGSITIAKLSRIARVLNLTPLQLLAPGMNSKDPPEVVSDPAEKALLQAFRRKSDGGRASIQH